MKKLMVFTLMILSIMACNSARQDNRGTYSLNRDGTIEVTGGKLRCTQPVKTFTKDLELKVDAEMKELNNLPEAKLGVGVNKTAVKLAQYTSEGLDRDQFVFRICEMLTNRVLSEETAKTLMAKAMDSYDKEVKKKNQN